MQRIYWMLSWYCFRNFSAFYLQFQWPQRLLVWQSISHSTFAEFLYLDFYILIYQPPFVLHSCLMVFLQANSSNCSENTYQAKKVSSGRRRRLLDIWISLLHIVVKRVRNSTARFHCVFSTASRTALGPTQPIQWVPGALSLGVKRLGR